MKRVVVIGAGISGLACARELRDTCEVVVVEARDRLGGRLHTTGDCVDLGGSWMHGSDNNVLMSFGVTSMESPDSGATSAVFSCKGKRWTAEECDESDSEWQATLAATAKARHGRDRGLLSALQPIATTDRWAHVLSMQTLMAADLEDVSLEHWDEAEEDTEGVDRYFPGGYKQIIDLIAAGTRVELGCIVEAVEERADSVMVRCRGGRTFEADCVVCTLPLGVLQRRAVHFEPPLPQPVVAAIDCMGFGTLGKVVLTFERVFWDAEAVWIGIDPSQTTRATFVEVLNLYRCNGRPILVGFCGGSFATGFSKRTDEDVAA